MQKKLIALAVAGLVAAPVAMAQSNVTIYGVADAYFGYGKAGDNKFRGVNSGGWAGSRIGFRGAEDLGNGLKAVFTLEYSIDIDANEGIGSSQTPDNARALRARQQFVGLQGGFGSLTLGRQYAPGFWIARYDAMGGSALGALGVLTAQSGSSITPASAARWNNSVAYKTPSMNGLTGSLIHSFGEKNLDGSAGGRNEDNKTGVAVDYANGPVAVTALYHYINNGKGESNTKEWGLQGSYDFGPAKLNATYQRAKDGSDKARIWTLGGVIPVSEAGNVRLSYGRLTSNESEFKAAAWSAGYTHSLSKRTSLYTLYTRVNNKEGTNFSGLARTATANFDKNTSTFAMGVTHTF